MRKDQAVMASVEEGERNKNERVMLIFMIRRLGVISVEFWMPG